MPRRMAPVQPKPGRGGRPVKAKAAAASGSGEEVKRRIRFEAPLISGGSSPRPLSARSRRVLQSSTPRSQALRSRFAALSDRTFPAGKPARTLGELTAQHLDYLRPKFFEGGRFSGGPGEPRPVPLRLQRGAFAEAVQPVLQLASHDSLLQLFSRMEVISGGGGVTWNALLTFVRQSVEGTGLGGSDDTQAACLYRDGQRSEDAALAGGIVQQVGAVDRCFLTIVGAVDLAPADENTGSSDPTAIVLWNGEKVYESSTKFATLRPVWRETAMLILPDDPAAQNELCIELYDRDTGTLYGDFLGRLVLEGKGAAGLSFGDETLAFRLQPDPLKDDNSFVQGVLAIQMSAEDPANKYSAPEYVHLTEEIAAAREGTLAASGYVASVTSTIGRAEQLRKQGHSWDRIVKVLEHEYETNVKHGVALDGQKLWWQSERQHRNDVMGVPKFLIPCDVPDEDGQRTVGCQTPYMVDKLGILDQYDCFFTACRGGTVHLWDVATMQPANPPTIDPPLASNRPIMANQNREYFINVKLDALETELQVLKRSELRTRADSLGVEAKLIERAVDEARLDEMAAERTKPSRGNVMGLTSKEQYAEKPVRHDKERSALIRLILDHVKNNTVPEADLVYQAPTPGVLYQRAQPRGLSKHRQCWILDAATLQTPEGWSDRTFQRKIHRHNERFNSLKSMGASKSTSIRQAASRANAGTEAEEHYSMLVAGPPKTNPVVAICADSTVRLWSRRPAHGYGTKPGELEGYWCKQRPRTGKDCVQLSERGTSLDLAFQLDCIPTCIARAKAGAISATWLDVEGIWSYEPRIVIGASDGTIRSWQVSWDGEYYGIEEPTAFERSVAKFHDSAVLTCLRATESYLVSGGQDCGVVLGDRHRWQPIWTGREHTEGVSCIDFQVGSNTFVSGGDDRLVALWDVSVGPKSTVTLPKSYDSPVVGVSFSDTHQHLLSVAYANQTVQLWDTRRTPICLQEAVDQSNHVAGTAPADTGKYTACFFDQASHSMVCAGTHVVTWRIRPKKPTFWLKFWRHIVRLVLVFLRWYVRHRRKRKPTTHSAAVLLAEFAPRLDSIITVDVNGVIRLWNAELATTTDADAPRSCTAEFSAFGSRVGGDTAPVERLTAAIMLPSGPGDSAGDLMTASQTGKLAVHSLSTSTIESMTLAAPSTLDAAGKHVEGWDGVPCEVSEMSFTPGLQGATRIRPVLLLGHDGTVWLCSHQQIEDARGRTTLAKPLQLIQSSVPTDSLTGLRLDKDNSDQKGIEDAPVVTTVCAYDARTVGGSALVLVGCRVSNKAGEAVIRAYERSSVNRPNFVVEPFSTPPQPDPQPQEFGDHRTCEYRYDPELRYMVYLPPEGKESKADGPGWIVPDEDAYQNGLLLVVRKDGVVHVVDMHHCDIIESFAVNLGSCPIVSAGGWEGRERLLICGNIDGFARILFIAGGPKMAKQCMKRAASRGQRGGVVNVRHTWRAHTAQITQAKTGNRGAGNKPFFCTAAADGEVKLWALDGSPIMALGIAAVDRMVEHASTKFRDSTRRAQAAGQKAPTPTGAISAASESSFKLCDLLQSTADVVATDVDAQMSREQSHEPKPPPGPRARKAGRVAKLMEYVEVGEAGIKQTAKSYRLEATARAAASSRRVNALGAPKQG